MFENLAKLGKALGGLVAAAGGTTAITQLAGNSNSKAGSMILAAGVALHGLSTAAHEYGPKVKKYLAAIQAAKAVLQEPDPVEPPKA